MEVIFCRKYEAITEEMPFPMPQNGRTDETRPTTIFPKSEGTVQILYPSAFMRGAVL